MLEEGAVDVMDGALSVDGLYERIGERIKHDIEAAILSVHEPPLSSRTIRARRKRHGDSRSNTQLDETPY